MQAVAERSTAPLLQAFVGDLMMDKRARDQLISTAKTGISWLMDERFHRLTENPTFTLTEVARGDVNLFIAVPPRSAELLAPLLRWIFADLFAAIDEDRQPDDDRLLLIIDEADSLGRFDELRTALTLLPGRGVSIWTLWQQHSQIIERYGPHGAATFLGSASVVTAADFADLDTDAVEQVSRALGTYTILVQASQQKAADGRQNAGSSEKARQRLFTRP